jgi:hypothetical protein
MVARYRVYDSRIASEFVPGGDVWEFNKKVTREIRDMAIVLAPMGTTGTLKRSHKMNVLPIGSFHAQGLITNDARHASWVHEGTDGPITTPSGGRMRFMAYYGYLTFPKSVRGQKAQPWLIQASITVLSTYGVAFIPDRV